MVEIFNQERYADEEVASSYGYFSGYAKPNEITDQIDILRLHWPSLNPDAALRYYREIYPTLWHPCWVEGPCALIRPGFFSDRYSEEFEEVLKVIKKDRKGEFYKDPRGNLSQLFLCQTDRTFSKMCQLMERYQFGSDILIVGEQFGIRHRGRSVRGAREKFITGEYGETAKNVATMILTNPIRLEHRRDLWLDCAGDKFIPEVNDCLRGPIFRFSRGKINFFAVWVDGAYDCLGAVSSFLLQ